MTPVIITTITTTTLTTTSTLIYSTKRTEDNTLDKTNTTNQTLEDLLLAASGDTNYNHSLNNQTEITEKRDLEELGSIMRNLDAIEENNRTISPEHPDILRLSELLMRRLSQARKGDLNATRISLRYGQPSSAGKASSRW